jgi:hypothetical protein
MNYPLSGPCVVLLDCAFHGKNVVIQLPPIGETFVLFVANFVEISENSSYFSIEWSRVE